MAGKEWALITFTILGQMSVGALVVLVITRFWAARKMGAEQADRLSDVALYAIGPVIVLALLASLGHLGNPINAPRAITNLATSWLSREILSSVIFTGLGALYALLQWRKLASAAVRNTVAVLAALVGLFLVFSMSQVYMLETHPAWNSLATPVQFYATTFLLGGLAVGTAFMAHYAYLKQKDPGCIAAQCVLVRDALKGIAVVGVLFLGLELVTVPLQISSLASLATTEATGSAGMLFSEFGVLFGLRLGLVFLGAGLLGVFIYRYAVQEGKEGVLATLAYGAFVLVLASEVIGRFLFYAASLKIGI